MNIRKWTMLTTGLTGFFPTIVALIMSLGFWSDLFKSEVAGVLIPCLLEGIALFMYVLTIFRIPHPLLPFRYIQPLLAAVTTGEQVGTYYIQNLYSLVPLSIGLGIFSAVVIGFFVHTSLHAMELCFISPEERQEEAEKQRIQRLKNRRESLVQAFKGELIDARQTIETAQIATEQKKTALIQTQQQLQLNKKEPKTIADFRTIGMSVKNATLAARLVRTGKMTKEKMIELSKV